VGQRVGLEIICTPKNGGAAIENSSYVGRATFQKQNFLDTKSPKSSDSGRL
jgi:hypothetical protein